MANPGSGAFVGRQHELDLLLNAIEPARERGDRTTWLLGGEAGVGKTRLIEELVGNADSDAVTVVIGGCIHTADGSLPFVAITEALRHLCARFDASQLATATAGLPAIGLLLPELVSHTPEAVAASAAEESQVRLFDSVLNFVTRLGDMRRVCIVLEDLHWADTSTRDLFVFLVHNLADAQATLVATYRSDEMSRTHPLRPVLAELDRSPRVAHMTLSPFSAAELSSYAATLLDTPPSANVLDEVALRSRGNAFYASEILDALAAGRRSVRPELTDLILARVEGLTNGTQELLRLLSVAGESARDELLQAVSELSDADLLASLREALEHQVITLTDDGPLRFRHALMQEAVYSTLLPTERQRAHARYAHALLEAPRLSATPDSGDAELAWHFREAREFERALSASVAAARSAEARLAFPEAVNHIETVIEIWRDVDNPEQVAGRTEAETLRWAAWLAEASGNYSRAVQYQRTGIEAEGEIPDNELALHYVRLGRLLQNVGRPEEALKEYERAVDLVPPEPPSMERALVMAGYGQELMLKLEVERAADVLNEAIDIAREVGARGTEGHALNSLGSILLHQGHANQGVALLEEAQEIARAEASTQDLLRTYVNLVGGLQEAGDLQTAERLGREGMVLSAELGHERSYGFFIASNLIETLTEMGRFDEAESLMETIKRPEGTLAEIWLIHPLVDIPLRRGDVAVAAAAIETVAPHLVGSSDPQVVPTYWQRRASVAMAQGDLEAVRPALEAGLDAAMVITHILELRLAVISLEVATMAEDPAAIDRASEQVAEIEALIDARVDPDDSRSYRIMAVRAQARAEVASARGQDATELWEESANRWAAGGLSWHSARAQLRLGETLLAAGRRDEAADALTQCAELAANIGASALAESAQQLITQAGLGATADSDAAGCDLTGRELEVLRLLAEGQTNRQIGEALFISPKTVSVHVSRILQKFQVENRTEAAAAGRRAGLV